jgi:hypothetical protein
LNVGLANGRTAEVVVGASFDGVSEELTVELPLAGPGDVRGLAPGAISRRWPAPGSSDTPAGLMAYVEFAEDDLPWRLSPQVGARRQPWLTLLLVNEDEEGVRFLSERQPNAVLELSGAATTRLPDPQEAWALAHVETTQGTAPVARLLAARRLEAGLRWRAVLVPVFEAGRLAGLGDQAVGTSSSYAWMPGVATSLPVFATWTFFTSTISSFEEVAKKLKPSGELPIGAFYRWSEDTRAALGLHEVSAASFYRTALKPLNARFDAVSAPPRFTAPRPVHVVGAAVERVLDHKHLITPPIYGSTHVPAAGRPAWLADINFDPGLRAMAGLGAELVRRRQDTLISLAWGMAGQIDEANYLIGSAGFGAQASRKSFIAMAKMSDERFVAATGALHARTLGPGTGSMAAELSGCPHAGAATPYARRALRRAARLRAGGANPSLGSPALLAAVNAAEVLPCGTPVLIKNREGSETGESRLILTQMDALAVLGARLDVSPEDRRLQEAGAKGRAIIRQGGALPSQADGTRHVPSPDLGPLASHLRTQLEPRTALGRRIASRVSGGRPDAPLQRIIIEPEIDLALLDLLAAMAPSHVTPALEAMAPDSISLLDLDRPACEALLLGANHELMRELLWRGYPGRLGMTPLRRLFPQAALAGQANSRTSAHTLPIASWTGVAGTHLNEAVNAVLLMRSAVLQLFPDTIIYAFPAAWGAGDTRVLAEPGRHQPVHPIIQGQLPPDATYLGFALSSKVLVGAKTKPAELPQGATARAGYWLVLHGPEGQEGFGFDDPNSAGSDSDIAALFGWDDVAWNHVGWTRERPVFSPSAAASGVPFGEAASGLSLTGHSGQLAAIMATRPLTIAIHMSDLIGNEGVI